MYFRFRTSALALMLLGGALAGAAAAQGAGNDPCSQQQVEDWQRLAYVSAQEASRKTQQAIAADPESPVENMREEMEAVEEELDACRVTAHEAILDAAAGVLDIIKNGAEGLAGLIRKIAFPDLDGIDLKKAACKVLVAADKVVVGGVEMVSGLPRGIETDVRYAIWRNQRQAEGRGDWVVRYARHAPRRWSAGQVRGFMYETRKELAGGYPDVPWPPRTY